MGLIEEGFVNKKIGILGYGVEGIATDKYLAKHGHEAIIFDRLESDEFFKKHQAISSKRKVFLGESYLNHLAEAEIIFKAPGIPVLWPEIQAAIRGGAILTSQTEFFLNHCPAPIIGVTGTKGKGTTSTLIANILEESGKRVFLGGNIGLAAITFLDQVTKDSIVVLELSSFQLQALTKSPHIAVVLNITQDHLDYHKTVSEYRKAKKNIVKYQTGDDIAIINADYKSLDSFKNATKAEYLYFSKKKTTNGCYVDSDENIILMTEVGPVLIAKVNELLLRGRHNLENVTAAILAGYTAGAKIESIQDVVKNFRGLEHRLERVGDSAGVTYYNDSFSTTPETTIAAIKSFTEPIILIVGGSSKNSDYSELGRLIGRSKVKAAIFIGETAEKISDSIGGDYRGKKIFGLTKMQDIVKVTRELSASGDIVLLSPACASFGLFQDYKDRGNQFKKCVEKTLHK
ncbi:MAG: UDP-N-acetylmuramoyl-L-alanine--D-glutamate ligase [bacterium]